MFVNSNFFKDSISFLGGVSLAVVGYKCGSIADALSVTYNNKLIALSKHVMGYPLDTITNLIDKHKSVSILTNAIHKKFSDGEIGSQAFLEFNNMLEEGMKGKFSAELSRFASSVAFAAGVVLISHSVAKLCIAAERYFRSLRQ